VKECQTNAGTQHLLTHLSSRCQADIPDGWTQTQESQEDNETIRHGLVAIPEQHPAEK